jgi:uncharacterized protein YigA (DUF484 family)
LSDVLRIDAHQEARDQAIRAFLMRRPEFLRDDPGLMQALGVRPDAANVVDFGPEALSRVAKAHRKESSERRRIEAVAAANFDAQTRTQEAVVDLIGARNHADLARRLDELAQWHFDLEAAVIALEGPDHVPEGWRALAEGQCDQALGDDKAARLGVLPTALGLFGERAETIGSVALIRLSIWAPGRVGVLAFGASSPDTFAADMGHELIDFLARVVERTAERWPLP